MSAFDWSQLFIISTTLVWKKNFQFHYSKPRFLRGGTSKKLDTSNTDVHYYTTFPHQQAAGSSNINIIFIIPGGVFMCDYTAIHHHHQHRHQHLHHHHQHHKHHLHHHRWGFMREHSGGRRCVPAVGDMTCKQKRLIVMVMMIRRQGPNLEDILKMKVANVVKMTCKQKRLIVMVMMIRRQGPNWEDILKIKVANVVKMTCKQKPLIVMVMMMNLLTTLFLTTFKKLVSCTGVLRVSDGKDILKMKVVNTVVMISCITSQTLVCHFLNISSKTHYNLSAHFLPKQSEQAKVRWRGIRRGTF